MEPRPGISARLTRRNAIADSLREARKATDDPAAQLAAELQTPRPRRNRGDRPEPVRVAPIPRDSIAGSFVASGEATGQIKNLDVTTTAKTPGITWGGNLIGSGSAKGKWSGLGTPNDSLTVEGGVDSLRAAGFALDSTRFRGRYIRGEGDAEIAIYPGDSAEYVIGAQYVLHTGEGEIRLNAMRLRFDSTNWVSTRPSRITWHGQGITVDSLELRDGEGRGGGRIFVNGEMPDADPGRLEVNVDSLRIAPWLTLAQSDVAADGVASLHVVVEGRRQSPTLEGTVTITDPTYDGKPFPNLHSQFKYDQHTLTLDGDIRRATGAPLATVVGTLPVDLSFGDSVATRFPEEPLALTIEGDSIPLSPIAEFVEGFTQLDGHAFGKMVLRGTWKKPQLEGGMAVDIRRLGLASTGVLMTNVTARSHMVGDTLVIDSLFARSGGTIRGTGTIALPGLRSPTLQLELRADDARVLDDERGELFANGIVNVSGPIDTITVVGSATVTRGVVYIPDPSEFDIINTEDPAIFAVVDSATALEAGLAPVSEMMKNLVVDVDIVVNRGTFGRSRDANVEVYGDLNVVLNAATDGEFALTGALYTDYGDYTFLGKRFVVTRGSVRFTGDTDLNPNVQVLATYEVRQAGRPPLDIRVVIGGTLEKPKISLESDAQPTLSQSDLISFLAFGKSSASLLTFSGTGLSGGGQGGSSLAGNVAALAKRQLASIALGALADEAKADLASATHADVLNITPAELDADLSLSAFQTVLRGTEIEIGKYVDRSTFVLARVRPTFAVPGASVERRFGQQLKLRTTFETRFQARRPSLS
ncbi:MAG: translocation/assembly module TamB domain-containing protein, partial [Gemmatimonadaceae bacterium]